VHRAPRGDGHSPRDDQLVDIVGDREDTIGDKPAQLVVEAARAIGRRFLRVVDVEPSHRK
jgi:hypothetical protein